MATLTDITPEEEKKIEALIKGHPLPPQTYNYFYRCSNCGWGGEVEIPKGVRTKFYRCPQCACTDADLTGNFW